MCSQTKQYKAKPNLAKYIAGEKTDGRDKKPLNQSILYSPTLVGTKLRLFVIDRTGKFVIFAEIGHCGACNKKTKNGLYINIY